MEEKLSKPRGVFICSQCFYGFSSVPGVPKRFKLVAVQLGMLGRPFGSVLRRDVVWLHLLDMFVNRPRIILGLICDI